MSRDYQTQTPIAARVVEFIQESDAIFTLRLQLEDAAERARLPVYAGAVQHVVSVWCRRGPHLYCV